MRFYAEIKRNSVIHRNWREAGARGRLLADMVQFTFDVSKQLYVSGELDQAQMDTIGGLNSVRLVAITTPVGEAVKSGPVEERDPEPSHTPAPDSAPPDAAVKPRTVPYQGAVPASVEVEELAEAEAASKAGPARVKTKDAAVTGDGDATVKGASDKG